MAKGAWTGLGAEDMGAAAHVPTMLGPDEQALYLWLGQTAQGPIVDLGCFAGGSSARLAEGAARAGQGVPVHGFDRFTADPSAKARFLLPAGIAPFDGMDIFPLAQRLLAPWPHICLHRGEIDQATWTQGPIDTLVLDASKSTETMDKMAETFFPHLVPGQSLLVQQDYLHWRQPWVPVQMALMANRVRPLAFAAPDTVVFLLTADGPPPRTGGLSDTEMQILLARAAVQVAPLGLGPRFGEIARALAQNPGKRRAHAFARPT